MSTRSRVGIKEKDGTIRSVYIHHDGYVAYVGKILYESYRNPTKIEQLINLGDMSSINSEIETCRPYTQRGEDLNIAIDTVKSFDRNWASCGEEYVYLYTDGRWMTNSIYKEKWESLDSLIKDDEISQLKKQVQRLQKAIGYLLDGDETAKSILTSVHGLLYKSDLPKTGKEEQ